MSDTPVKVIVDCATGDVQTLPLTTEELQQREADAAQALADQQAREAEAQTLADLKASARTKLIAGQALSAEEASVIVL